MDWIRQVKVRVRPAVLDVQAALRWRRLHFDQAPPIFANAKPKSGSHLLLQILAGLPRILPSRYVQADPVRTITREGVRRDPQDILADLMRLPQGVIGWGYVEPSTANVAFLCKPGRVNYFLYRDPRDMLVSHVHFATDMQPEHGMHDFYALLPDFSSRLNVAITGIDHDGLKMVSVRQRYESVLQWLALPNVLCLRFEDLVERPRPTLARMLDQITIAGYQLSCPRDNALDILGGSIQPSRSRTFRSGKTGGWRQSFTADHKRLFLDVAGDLLIGLGYERDNNW